MSLNRCCITSIFSSNWWKASESRLELFLKLNGAKLNLTNDEIVEIYLAIADGKLSRDDVEEKFAEGLIEDEN